VTLLVNCLQLCAILSFFSVVEVVISMGEVDPVTKNVFQIQFFVFTNGGNDSNFDSVFFSRSVLKNFGLLIPFQYSYRNVLVPCVH